MKSKVDKLDVDKSIPVLVDLSKESDVVKMMLLKKDVYYCKKWNIEDEISDITILATNTILNSKINKLNKKIQSITNLTTTAALDTTINEVNDKIPSISNLAATIALNTAENKKPNVINLDKKTDSNIKTNEIKKKILNKIMINILLLQNLIS